MCTLTYYPQSKTSFVLTHNRDELVSRGVAHHPKKQRVNNVDLLFPQDPDAGGTWIALGEGRSACLLNGAFERYRHTPPYKKSRGLVLLESFDYKTGFGFASDYDFSGVAPFTLVLADHALDLSLIELKWDGDVLHRFEHNPQEAHIWSAATLYIPEVRMEREAWFAEYRRTRGPLSEEELIEFHMFGGVGDPHKDLRVKKGKASTVSISQIRKSTASSLWYKDLIANTVSECQY